MGADLDCSRTSPFTCIRCYLALRRMKMGNSQSPLVVPADSASRGPGRVQGSLAKQALRLHWDSRIPGGQMGGWLVYTASRPNSWGNCNPFHFLCCLKEKSDFNTQCSFLFSFFVSLAFLFFLLSSSSPTPFSFPFLFLTSLFLSLFCFLLLSNFHNIVLCRENFKRNKSFIFRTRGFFSPKTFIFNWKNWRNK